MLSSINSKEEKKRKKQNSIYGILQTDKQQKHRKRGFENIMSIIPYWQPEHVPTLGVVHAECSRKWEQAEHLQPQAGRAAQLNIISCELTGDTELVPAAGPEDQCAQLLCENLTTFHSPIAWHRPTSSQTQLFIFFFAFFLKLSFFFFFFVKSGYCLGTS